MPNTPRRAERYVRICHSEDDALDTTDFIINIHLQLSFCGEDSDHCCDQFVTIDVLAAFSRPQSAREIIEGNMTKPNDLLSRHHLEKIKRTRGLPYSTSSTFMSHVSLKLVPVYYEVSSSAANCARLPLSLFAAIFSYLIQPRLTDKTILARGSSSRSQSRSVDTDRRCDKVYLGYCGSAAMNRSLCLSSSPASKSIREEAGSTQQTPLVWKPSLPLSLLHK